MQQTDLFEHTPADRDTEAPAAAGLDVRGLLEQLTALCDRPRYNFMLLTLIAEASRATGSAGPFVEVDGRAVMIRDWLCDAMSPVGRREPRRLSMIATVREELAAAGILPTDEMAAAAIVDDEVRLRLRKSGRTNVSRAVSELVRAGLVSRYYKGDYVDHENRGGQRHAVYVVSAATRRALASVLRTG